MSRAWTLGPLFALVVAAISATLPSPSPAAERTHPITLDDYFTLALVDKAALSPRGTYVAYTELRWDEDLNKRNYDLWVVEPKTGDVTRLTFDPAADDHATWSPDETWIYFTTSRERDEKEAPYNGKTQVWRVAPTGGEIFPVTRLEEGVDGFALSADGHTLYYTTGQKHYVKDEWESLRREFPDVEYGDGVITASQLWSLDLRTWRSRKLVDEGRVIVDFSVSPDERHIALLTRPDNELISNEGWSTVDLYDAATGSLTTLPDRQWREDAPSPYGWLLSPRWSSDSKALAFHVGFDGYPAEIFVVHLTEDGAGAIDKVVRPDEVSAESDMEWMPGTHTLCFLADDHARERVYAVPGIEPGRQKAGYALTPGDVVITDFSFGDDGTSLSAVMSSLDHTDEVYLFENPGPRARPRRLTHLNPQMDTWKLPQISLVRWTSPDGTPVEGVLELPPDYEEGDGPLPLVVELHGGPTDASRYEFRYWIYGRTLFAAQGWALLSPNYRGSTGYGDTFLVELIGHENDRDVADILSGVDMLIEKGIADPERMAVMGWSNGGFLTNCVVTHDARFKAGSSGAGVFDQVMQWEIEDTPGHVINYMQGLPWENPGEMHRASPLYQVDKVKAAMLIHVGGNDPRVPPQQSKAFHRALHRYLDVPTELIVYPGAGHGLTKYDQRKAKLTWDHRWFDHYVLGKPDEAME